MDSFSCGAYGNPLKAPYIFLTMSYFERPVAYSMYTLRTLYLLQSQFIFLQSYNIFLNLQNLFNVFLMSTLHKQYEKIQLNRKFSETVQYMTIYISVIYSENYTKFIYHRNWWYNKTNPSRDGWDSHLVGVVPGGRTISATDFCMGHSRAGM